MAIVTVALFDLDILRDKIPLLPRLALLTITLAAWVFFFWYCKRLKFVSVDDHALYVSDWFHGTTILLAQGEYVYESAFQTLIFVGLRSPSRYGRKIVFMPIIPVYPDTLNLKTMVHLRDNGIRPYVELEDTDHPLARQQHDGITLDRVMDIIHEVETMNRIHLPSDAAPQIVGPERR